jgi:hypothetical protein
METVALPDELQYFVEPNTRPISLATADLNDDG